MPKRKREALEEAGQNGTSKEESLPSLEYARLERQLEIGHKALQDALKLARGFERQKLGRRQKTAKTKNDSAGTTRLVAEVQALKSLDLEITAKSQLPRQLAKVKRIREETAFMQYLSKHPPPLPRRDDTVITVIARLINSNPVKEVLPRIIDTVRQALGLEKVEKVPGKSSQNNKPEDKVEGKTSSAQTLADTNGELGYDVSDSSEWQGFSASDANQGLSDTGSEADEAEFEHYDDLVASSTSDTDPDIDITMAATGLKKVNPNYNHDVDMSLSPSDSEQSSSDSVRESKSKGKIQKRAANTTFLPSLMGGYWSGSDSEEVEGAAIPKPKKNRMGQQARRAIWEKKYGDKANHLKDEARDTGWDPKRGATEGDRRGRHGGGRGAGWNSQTGAGRGQEGDPGRAPRGDTSERRVQRTGSNMDPVKPRKTRSKEAQGKLHPSWEAAKKAKEQKTTAAFQGKKITF